MSPLPITRYPLPSRLPLHGRQLQRCLDPREVVVAMAHRVVLEHELCRERGVRVQRYGNRDVENLIVQRADRSRSRGAVAIEESDRLLLRHAVKLTCVSRVDVGDDIPRYSHDRLTTRSRLRDVDLNRVHVADVVHSHAYLS